MDGFKIIDGKVQITKDPNAVLNYTFNWSTHEDGTDGWLEVGDSISTAVITITNSTTLTKDSSTISGGKKVVVVLSGGTARELAAVACKITTANGLVDERTIYVRVQDR